MTRRERFVLVKNEHDLTRIHVLRPELLRQATAVAGTPHAALLLRESGVSGAVILPDLLSDDQRLACVRDAQRISQTWHEMVAGAEFEPFTLAAQLLRDDLLSFFVHATAAHHAIEALCARTPGAEFGILDGAPRPSMWETEYNCSHGLIEATIRDMASRGSARIECIKPLPLWHPARIGRRLMRALQPAAAATAPRPIAVMPSDAGQEIAWLVAVGRRGGNPLALAVGDDISLAMMFGFAPGLEAAGYTVLGASTSSAPQSVRKRTLSRAERPYVRLSAMPGGPRPARVTDFVAIRRHFETRRLAHGEAALRNPFLAFQYDHIFSELMPLALRAYTSIAHAIETLEPSLVLVASHGFASHAAAIAARARGTRSVMVQHGGALTWMHSTSSDAVWAWGATPAEIIRDAYRWPASRVPPIGAPHLAHVGPRAENVALRGEIRRRFDVPPDGRMLVVITSGCTEGPWQGMVTATFIEAWDQLLAWTKRNPDITVVLRPHPLMDMNAWYRLAARRRRLDNVRFGNDGAIDEIVAGADAAIVMEMTTTAALVAHAAACPVLHARSARWNVEGDGVWTEDRGLTVARHPAQIGPLLDRLLRDRAARDACVRGGRRFFDAYVADSDRVIERVRDAAADGLAPTTPARFA